ncbi:MAG: multifunctional CCA addition/repair protein [Candidatus Thiodiazotropha lotti]|uniref:multifunctional CCA addition/repair protein n=1 Tax=Candidatus Thiodiazotropha endoloripes TaxID=1818881 RepID=UPI00083D607F|nr:multifunctional CCA addition/repair protein [Candidatus Thiodiazotropha endoloripes]MCG7897185.1 multifunctional CCA addition/repair protein [Candidatus Thiodiazotropha weberae]MCG7991509.1 multifunctional CCA addition/repair protein [Candidatus Thiodiazotropha lotti]MCG7999533.1 multifunctional CCA addition/repair protein [Candidatus Thiodiazotropha lotti]MCW4183164.1 multifunctional CCA addition/repair protein [Candidatus Thiodiazotropha weberae]MCW4191301.1 multifunctional CCA addition/r
MQIYLVGGAVRDRLLGRLVTEKDYVVVGATPTEMLDLGYRQVGRDFPVFLHPQTNEEYALARTLRHQGHQPGVVIAEPGVTLEEDLQRRDLTINAIAEDGAGNLIDPFNGVEDLNNRVLRHVSSAFSDDPVRVLRLARFMARYNDPPFTIAPQTVEMIRAMVEAGELDNLVAERIWQETSRALAEANPVRFFESLRELGVLGRIMPEVENLWGVPQPTRWHPEVDCGVHTMMALRKACELSSAAEVRYATLTHDLGKATTPKEILPSHHGHESRGADLIKALGRRLKVPSGFTDLAHRAATYHTHLHHLYELKPKTVLKLLEGLDAFRKPRNLEWFVLVCQADFQGREGFEDQHYPQARDLMRAYHAACSVDSKQLPKGLIGPMVGVAMRQARSAKIAAVLNRVKQQQECQQQ